MKWSGSVLCLHVLPEEKRNDGDDHDNELGLIVQNHALSLPENHGLALVENHDLDQNIELAMRPWKSDAGWLVSESGISVSSKR